MLVKINLDDVYSKQKRKEDGNSGIYKIVNTASNKVYIGQSYNVYNRLLSHRKDMRGNYHPNEHLQRSFNKYGEECFEYYILELCPLEEMTIREAFWIDIYESHNKDFGYNIYMPNESLTGLTASPRTRKLISDRHKEFGDKFSDEELLSFLHEFYYMEGRLPKTKQDLTSKGYPGEGTYFSRFGGLKNAFIKAGLYHAVKNKKMFDRRKLTKQEVYDNYKNFVDIHGRFPNAEEIKNTKESGLVSSNVVYSVYSSIQDLKDELGFSKERMLREENTEALLSLRKLYEELGEVNRTIIDKSPITRSTKFYSNRFGSLNNAYKLAGIDMGCRLSIPIIQLTKDGHFVRRWESSTEAEEESGVTSANISHVLNGRNSTAGGYVWVYERDYLCD